MIGFRQVRGTSRLTSQKRLSHRHFCLHIVDFLGAYCSKLSSEFAQLNEIWERCWPYFLGSLQWSWDAGSEQLIFYPQQGLYVSAFSTSSAAGLLVDCCILLWKDSWGVVLFDFVKYLNLRGHLSSMERFRDGITNRIRGFTVLKFLELRCFPCDLCSLAVAYPFRWLPEVLIDFLGFECASSMGLWLSDQPLRCLLLWGLVKFLNY